MPERLVSTKCIHSLAVPPQRQKSPRTPAHGQARFELESEIEALAVMKIHLIADDGDCRERDAGARRHLRTTPRQLALHLFGRVMLFRLRHNIMTSTNRQKRVRESNGILRWFGECRRQPARRLRKPIISCRGHEAAADVKCIGTASFTYNGGYAIGRGFHCRQEAHEISGRSII